LNKPYVIIGCQPGPDAEYRQKVMEELGLEIGVGEAGADGVVGWQHLIPNHPWTLKALRKGKGRQKVYMMELRHPVPTINSMAAMYFRRDWPPLPGEVPVEHMFRFERNDTPVIRAMRLYYHLNSLGMKDQKFKIIYPVEDIGDSWDVISEAIGFPGTEMPEPAWDRHREDELEKYPNMQWRDIFDAFPAYGTHIARLADCMGYNVGDWDKTELAQWVNQGEKNS